MTISPRIRYANGRHVLVSGTLWIAKFGLDCLLIPGTQTPFRHISTRFGGTDFFSTAERFGTARWDNLAKVLLYLLLSTLLPLEDRGTSWKKSLQKKEQIVGVVPDGTHPMGLAKKKEKKRKSWTRTCNVDKYTDT